MVVGKKEGRLQCRPALTFDFDPSLAILLSPTSVDGKVIVIIQYLLLLRSRVAIFPVIYLHLSPLLHESKLPGVDVPKKLFSNILILLHVT